MQPLPIGSSQGNDATQNGLSADSSQKSVAPFFAGWNNRWKFDNAQFLPQNTRSIGKKADNKKWWIAGATSLISAPLLIFGVYKGHKTGFFTSIRDAFKNWRQAIKAGKPYQSFDRVKVENDHSALQAENARLKNENDEAVRAKNLAEEAKEALEREKAQLEGQRDLLAREKDTALAAKESIAQEKASLESAKSQTEATLRARDSELQRVKAQVENSTIQLRDVEAKEQALKQQLEAATAKVSGKEGQVLKLSESLEKAE